MTNILIDPKAVEKITSSRPKLAAESWGGNETVCMMSALVSGASGIKDCVTAGWPEWLVSLNINLFDEDIRADDEDDARFHFALDIAHAVQTPRDYGKALDLFLIARLDTGDYSALKSLALVDGDWSQQKAAIVSVVALLQRRVAGEDVSKEIKDAADAAATAAYAAARAAAAARASAAAAAADAAYAARAAAYAASGAAVAAARASAAAYAAAAARAATAAYAAARADLVNAINAS